MKIVVSVGGSVLVRAIESGKVQKLCCCIKRYFKKERGVHVTVRKSRARLYRSGAELGADEATCDFIGIEPRRLNARLLIAALGGRLRIISHTGL